MVQFTTEIDDTVVSVAIMMLLGNLFPIMFGSALIATSGHYVSSCTPENRGIKRLVYAGLVLLVIHVSLAFADTARTFGEGFGSVDRVYALSPIFVAGMCINATTAALVQSFYAWRCFRLLGNRIWLLIFLGVFIVFSFGSQVVAEIVALLSDDPGMFMSNGPTIQAFVYLRLPYLAAIAIDTFLCALTLFALYRAQALGNAQGVGKIMKKLVSLTVTSFALTTTFCVFLLIVSALSPGAFWACTLSSSDVYWLTLLVWLYSRRSPTTPPGSNLPSSDPNYSASKGSPRRTSHFRKTSDSPILANAIHVHTSQLTKVSESDSQDSSFFDNDKDSDIRALA